MSSALFFAEEAAEGAEGAELQGADGGVLLAHDEGRGGDVQPLDVAEDEDARLLAG